LSTEPSSGFASRLQQAWLARGPLAIAMLPLAIVFGIATALRRGLYRLGVLRAHRLAVPVVVVGNLIAGGAGKTPTVLAIVEALRRHGYAPGIVSRGHGGSEPGPLDVTRATPAARCGDEPLLMHLRAEVPVVIGRDRVAAARWLLHRHPSIDVIVSDDGLQHLSLGRNAQVLVFDERGAGNGWLLPAGPLREALPPRAPRRTLVVYNASTASTPLPGTLAQRSLGGVVSLAGWWRGEPASRVALDALRGQPLIAAAGLGRPQRFFDMLRAEGLSITALPLPDHHDYATLPWPANTSEVVLTEKDAIKLDPSRAGTVRIWVAPLDFALAADFDQALIALLPPLENRHGNTPA
jgi:tetraacyldisaccharide 4'-kinase